ncbi:MAG: ribonuclease D [Phycisphaerae bacterium]
MTNPSDYLIAERSGLKDAVSRLRDAGVFGFDTEFIRERSYVPELCLVQAATDDFIALIDPYEVKLDEFWELVADSDVEKIVHAGDQDFEMGYLQSGLAPSNIFDIQIAAGLVGLEYPLSFGRLVEEVTGEDIPQGKSYSDWSRRPLTDSQMHYAVADAVHLLPARHELRKRLVERDRLDWLREEMAPLEDESTYAFDPARRAARIKGSGNLSRRRLALLTELVVWREEGARRADLPPQTFLRDGVLVGICREVPKTIRQLSEVRGFPRPVAHREGRRVLEIIRRIAEIPKSELPPAPRRVPSRVDDKPHVNELIKAGREICEANDINPQLFASRSLYSELYRLQMRGEDGDLPRLLRGWRGEFAGKKLARMINN